MQLLSKLMLGFLKYPWSPVAVVAILIMLYALLRERLEEENAKKHPDEAAPVEVSFKTSLKRAGVASLLLLALTGVIAYVWPSPEVSHLSPPSTQPPETEPPRTVTPVKAQPPTQPKINEASPASPQQPKAPPHTLNAQEQGTITKPITPPPPLALKPSTTINLSSTSPPPVDSCPAPGKLVSGWTLLSRRSPGVSAGGWGIQPSLINVPASVQQAVESSSRMGIGEENSRLANDLLSEIRQLKSLDDPKPRENAYGPIANQELFENIEYTGGNQPTLRRTYHFSIPGQGEIGPIYKDDEVPLADLSAKSQNTVRNIDVWVKSTIDKRCIDAMAASASKRQ